MIIEGSTHGNAGNLARYLLRAKPGEKEFLFELRDAASDDLAQALTDWELCGRALTKGRDILMHSYIRLPVGEAMQEAQWHTVIQRLEEKLGLTNCPRAIVGHNSEKGLHVHVAWSRLDAQTEILAPLHYSRRTFHDVARWAEKEFGLTPVESKPEKEQRKNRRMSDREIRAFKDRGIDREKLEKIVRAAWNGTDSGEEMKAMLGALGVEIKPGDRRAWVVEYKGLKMNPVRLLDDVNEAKFRERMKDVDLEKAKEQAREKSPVDTMFGRKARHVAQGQIDRNLANDEAVKPPKTGFTKKRHKAPQPRLRRKMWYGDPGI
jgi:hypothetical protein